MCETILFHPNFTSIPNRIVREDHMFPCQRSGGGAKPIVIYDHIYLCKISEGATPPSPVPTPMGCKTNDLIPKSGTFDEMEITQI